MGSEPDQDPAVEDQFWPSAMIFSRQPWKFLHRRKLISPRCLLDREGVAAAYDNSGRRKKI